MPNAITASVGFAGKNRRDDVATIQSLLNKVPPRRGGPLPQLLVDGICGVRLVAAIREFQKVNQLSGDGRIDSGGPTLAALQPHDDAVPVEHKVPCAVLMKPFYAQPVSTSVHGPLIPTTPVAPSGGHKSRFQRSWFTEQLFRLERALKGNARQSWGRIIWGEGSGAGSTATKLSSDGKLTGPPFDFKKFRQELEALEEDLALRPDCKDYLKQVRSLIKCFDDYKDVNEVGEKLLELAEDWDEIKGTMDPADTKPQQQEQNAAAVKPVTRRKPERHQVAQYVAYDGSGNMYVKIVYSDGSRKYLFASMFGSQAIDDPGDMAWRQTQTTQGKP